MSLEDDAAISAINFDMLCKYENKTQKNQWEIVYSTRVRDLEDIDFVINESRKKDTILNEDKDNFVDALFEDLFLRTIEHAKLIDEHRSNRNSPHWKSVCHHKIKF